MSSRSGVLFSLLRVVKEGVVLVCTVKQIVPVGLESVVSVVLSALVVSFLPIIAVSFSVFAEIVAK
jgi:hypothetical protein